MAHGNRLRPEEHSMTLRTPVFPLRRPWLLLLPLAIWFPVAQAQSPVSLLQAYEAALRFDPVRQAASEALEVGREKTVQGDSLLKPRVGLQWNVSRVDDRSANTLAPPLAQALPAGGIGTVRQSGIQLVQPLYNATASAERQQLHEQTKRAEAQFAGADQDLVKRVTETYFALLVAEETLRVSLAEQAAVGAQMERAQARLEVGRGKVTEVREIGARLESVRARVIAAQGALKVRRLQLEELTGLSAPTPYNLSERAPVMDPPPDDVSRLTRDAQARNPKVLAMAPDRNRVAAIGLVLNVPLYAGGGLESREREALARQRQAEQELLAVRRDVRIQVQDAYVGVAMGAANVGALEKAQAAAATALEATTLARDVGARAELDVVDAQQYLYESRLKLAQGRCDHLLARIRLSLAVGDSGEAELRRINSMLSADGR